MEKTSGVPTISKEIVQQRVHNENKIILEYYTDPLCAWSWSFEQHLDKLLEKHGDAIDLRVYMGGLISEWRNFNDPFNDISRPSQMGPHWLNISKTTGVEINTSIWINNPPVSSYPACIAVKCAEAQSKVAAYSLLKALRKAVMIDAIDISRNKEILVIAKKHFSITDQEFDYFIFEKDILEGNGIEDFRKDLILKERNQVTRLPGIILKNQKGNGLIFFGHRPYEVLEEIFKDFQTKSLQS